MKKERLPTIGFGIASTSLGIGAALSGLVILPILAVVNDGRLGVLLIILAMPGMFVSMACAGNVHAFSTSIVFLVNVLFYALIALPIIRRIERRRLANAVREVETG